MRKQEDWKPKFLIDQNISQKIASFLSGLGFDVKTLGDLGLKGVPDTEIVEAAKKEDRIVITFDKDFGEIYYFYERGKFTVIVLYIEDQTVQNVNEVLGKFLKTSDINVIRNKLVILYENKIRLVTG